MSFARLGTPAAERHGHKIRLTFAPTGTIIPFTLTMNTGSEYFSGSLKIYFAQ
ncbi:hypothetical protein JF634_07150 [Simonsiella muelleri]|uniref:hypothetical protein n=1 Tax=Simonsiella muelleri TaxID=72 RepID=UPI0001D09FCA|nr:hypothetical protein [Simonsiella muelleri]UBQ52991.1 hypothetical protein JF634_07150 [Simonsiella muelleri]